MNPKSKSKYCLTLAAILAATASIHAAPVIYEPFAQDAGSISGKAGGTGLNDWVVVSTASTVETSPTLVYGALQKTGGQLSLPNGGGQTAYATTTTALADAGLLANEATLWFSYLYSKGSGGGSNERSGFAFGTDHLRTNSTSGAFMDNGGNGLGVYSRSQSIQPSTWIGGGVGVQASGTSFANYNGTVLIVGRIVWGATPEDVETLTIWTPDVGSLPVDVDALGAGFSTTMAGVDQTLFDTISMQQRNSGSAQIYDEIRFAATYADVVPADTTAPVLLASIPADDGIAIVPTLQATFDDQIVAGSGNISIINDTDTITTDIAATDTTQVTFSGNDVTINPTTALIPGKAYHVLIDSGALQNAAGVTYAGISDPSVWNFTVETVAPVLVLPTIPADDSIDVAPNQTLVAIFDEPIVLGSGNVTITNVTNATTFATIDVTDATQVNIQGTRLIIDPDGGFDPAFEYAVQIASGAVTDLVGNNFAGVADNTTWSFTTSGFTLDASDPLVPAGLGNGDTFQLVFVTSTLTSADARDGTSDGIDNTLVIDWEDYVNSVASGSTLSTIADLQWNAIVSVNDPNNAVPGKAAKDHALVSAPVYRTDGTLVATGFSDMWSGSILAPIKWNQNGVEQNTAGGSSSGRQVWSGTNSDGTISNRPLGNSTSHIGGFSIRMGDADVTSASWIQTSDATRRAPTVTARVYALSQVITVTGAAASPFDTWANGTFGNGTLTDKTPTGDNDSDGLSNLLEFAFGTDPTVSDAGSLIWDGTNFTPGSPVVHVDYPIGGGVDFTARFIRRTDHGISGSAAYAWQFSSDLSDWEASDDAPAPGWLEAPTVLATDGDYQLVEVPYPLFLDSGKKANFFRVGLTLVP